MITKVTSTFSKGKFEQAIAGIIPEFAIKGDSDAANNRQTPPPTITTRSAEPGTPTSASTWENPQDDATGVDRAIEDQRARDDAANLDAFYNPNIGAQPTEDGVATDNSTSSSDQANAERQQRQREDIAAGGGREYSWYE